MEKRGGGEEEKKRRSEGGRRGGFHTEGREDTEITEEELEFRTSCQTARFS